MPIDGMPAYLPTRGESRTCPVCAAPSINLTDKVRSITKCITCGYSSVAMGNIGDQRFYDKPVLAFTSKAIKQGYYDTVEDVQSALFNVLVEAGWNKQEAVSSIIEDLDLKSEEEDAFLRKVQDVTDEI